MTSLLQRAARLAYSVLLTLTLPAYLARLWWRGRAEALYRHAVAERLGRYADAKSAGWVWVHAVSLGETRAAAALVEALRLQRPQMRLLLTHGTATGREAGRDLLREGDRQAWLPHDTRGAVGRFFRHFQPAVGVLMETEVWPNLLLEARAQAVPMVLANARLSPNSQRRGQRTAWLLRPAVQSLALVLAQTAADAQRLRDAGAPEVQVCGNLKFDMTPDAAQLEQGRAWRAAVARPIVLAASTREGEEAMLLAAWLAQRAHVGAAALPILLIVPRHPQRFDEVATLVNQSALALLRRSAWAQTPPDAAAQADVWLGDSIGELALYYAAAQVALLGGSFAPLGGQNLIEAAACGCPVVMGPHTYNFTEAAEMALAAGAAVRVANIEAGVQAALAAVAGVRREGPSAQALAFGTQHRGAARRMAERIAALLPRS